MPTGVTLVLNNEKDIRKTIIHFNYIIVLLSSRERLLKTKSSLVCTIAESMIKKKTISTTVMQFKRLLPL
jgi:hypothetical protein